LDHGQVLAVQTAINHVGWAFNRFLHNGSLMSHLVLHLLANEGAQFVSNQKGGAIAGGLALVENCKIPMKQGGVSADSERDSINDDFSGTSIFFV
jgi:hypothetical protein